MQYLYLLMSITNLQLITDALRDINVISEAETPSADQGAKALRRLNQMMELWKEQSLDVGYFAQSSTADDCPIPDWTELAVTNALSIALAPGFGATVSAELVVMADSSINGVRNRIVAEGLDNTDMSHLPRGTGHYGQGYNITNDL